MMSSVLELNIMNSAVAAPAAVAALEEKVYDEYGLVDVKAVAAVTGEPIAQLAKFMPVTPSALSHNPKSPRAQAAARRFVALLQRLTYNTGSTRQALIWLRRQNPELENKSPFEVIKQGHIDVVEDLLGDYETGQPG